MKIVVNKCFGGYGLSHYAKTLIEKKKGIKFDKNEMDPILRRDPISRTDPDLIEIVEKLGEKAQGDCSELKVVEIPDGADYYITDYDGLETVHYGYKMGTV